MSDKVKMFAVRVNGQWHCPEFRYNRNFGLEDDLHQSSFVMNKKIADRRIKEKVSYINRQLEVWLPSWHGNKAEWLQYLENWTNAEIVEWDLTEVPK
jgi:hypothetical protein